MKSYDFNAAIYEGDVYCLDCLPDAINQDEVSPIYAGEEWAEIPVCCVCETEHDYVTLLGEE